MKTTSFLTWLAGELAAVTEFDKMDDVPLPAEGEEVLGVLSDNLKALYTVFSKAADFLKAEAEAHMRWHEEGTETDELCSAFHASASEQKERVEILGNLFWYEAKKEISPELRAGVLDFGLRQGYQIAKAKPARGSLFGDLDAFDGIFAKLLIEGTFGGSPFAGRRRRD